MADDKTRRPTGTIPLPGTGTPPDKPRTLSGMYPVAGSAPAKPGSSPTVAAVEKKRTFTGMIPIVAPVKPAGGTPAAGMLPRDPRASLVIPVRYKFESFIDFVETQSMNISRSGMFVTGNESVPVGSVVEFEFSLADGFAIL